MNWKIFSTISFALIIPVILIWQLDSSDYGETLIFSRDSKQLETKTFDEIFGTETVELKTIKGFWLGLFPGDDSISFKMLLGVIPLSGIAFLCGVFGLIMHFRVKSKISGYQIS